MSLRIEGKNKTGTKERIVKESTESKGSWEFHGRQA